MTSSSSSPSLLSGAALLLLLSASTTHAFTPPSTHHATTTMSSSSKKTQLHLSKRINNKISLDSPKVATMENYGSTDNTKTVYCRCWKSETFPMCDGSHMAHNKECGDNVGPLIVSVDTKKKEEEEAVVEEEKALATPEKTTSSPFSKLKSIFQKGNKEGPTTKEKLAKMGLSALLSYGWVSNMSYAITLSLSWYTHSKKTGLSPLAPGQWKPFLAVYAGFYVFTNIIRPLRFGLSVVVSQYFDRFVGFIERKSGWGRKASIGVVVFLANVCGTFAAMGLGVGVASTLAGVPVFPPKVV
eukprot:scaffold5219_cov148-Skeletonema_dohrnii-CCMP3373.AAC.5